MFSCCFGLKNIAIPNSVTSIGYGAFYGCSGLTSVTIPNSVTSIGEAAFSYCTSLMSVTIPNSVTCIENYAFDACWQLTGINIPNSITSIGEFTFRDCYDLTSIIIPESVTRISQHAFYGCNHINRIDCMATTPPLAYNKTFSSSIYTKATLNVPEGCAEKYKAANVWKEFTNISILGASTGIKQIDSSASSACIYDINGTRIGKYCDDINNLKRGIYIIDSKKVYIR